MCLGVPGRVLDVTDEDGLRMGRVDFGGVARKVCLAHVPDVTPGEYVLVHVGFALSRLDELEARRVLELLSELGRLEEELPGETGVGGAGAAGTGAEGGAEGGAGAEGAA